MKLFDSIAKRCRASGSKQGNKASAPHKQSKKEKGVNYAAYQVTASGQRSQTGDRSEMCTNGMNNYQKFATLQMLNNLNDDT
jgi:hypothetical protein